MGDGGDLFKIIGLAALGIAALVGVIFVTKITLDKIRNKAKKVPGAETAELIKETLASGNYRVVTNIFGSKKELLDTQTWEGKELDYKLEAEFGRKNKIEIKL